MLHEVGSEEIGFSNQINDMAMPQRGVQQRRFGVRAMITVIEAPEQRQQQLLCRNDG
jgi:hypothetical protein